jgi:hypothetical protein
VQQILGQEVIGTEKEIGVMELEYLHMKEIERQGMAILPRNWNGIR